MKLLVVLFSLPALAFAQGALTPPDGAVDLSGPVPTMKTLDQVEPRIPLRAGSNGVAQNANGGYTISASGSYYLEGNLSVGTGDGIIIDVDNVSLDLSGFTIASFAASADGSGIKVDGPYSNIALRNGHIRGTTTYDESTKTFTGGGFSDGIYAGAIGGSRGTRVTGISVAGVYGIAINLGEGSIISGCTAATCAGGGFRADTVNDSSGTTCGYYVIVAETVANCHAYGVSDAAGHHAISANTATNCDSSSSGGCGIRANTVANCNGTSTSSYGIFATGTATGSTGSSSTSIGLHAIIATGCHGSSTSDIGLQAMQNATGCTGTTDTGSFGLLAGGAGAGGTAENCRGIVTAGTGTGLSAETAANCFGQSTGGLGLLAGTATNCTGTSVSGMGLQADIATGCRGATTSGQRGLYIIGTATNCRGKNPAAGGVALSATIAVACTAESGSILVINRYNMP